MVRSTVFCGFAIMACIACTSDLQAQRGRGGNRGQEVQAEQSVGFTVAERQIVVEFFANHRQDVEPLPPGIARNLARGKRLPPGIAKRQVPSQLQAQLPTHVGAEVSIFGDRIVLLEASGLVVDILEGVFH